MRRRVFLMAAAALAVGVLCWGGAAGAGDETKEDLLFVHLTDLHCAARSQNPPARFAGDIHTKDFVRSFRILELAVGEINRIEGVDFVVITGDLTDSGNDVEGLRKVKSILDGLSVPYYPVIGDHDRREVFRSVFGGALDASTDVKGRHLVMLDTSPGKLEADDLEWFVRDLDAHEGAPTMVFMHRPPLLSDVEVYLAQKFYGSRLRLGNADEVLAVIRARPWVKAVFAGHCHTATERTQDGCFFVTSASLIEPGNLYRVVRVRGDEVTTELRSVQVPP
ncbi:MAG: metallophosphoesterase [Planctomycetota bacterium]